MKLLSAKLKAAKLAISSAARSIKKALFRSPPPSPAVPATPPPSAPTAPTAIDRETAPVALASSDLAITDDVKVTILPPAKNPLPWPQVTFSRATTWSELRDHIKAVQGEDPVFMVVVEEEESKDDPKIFRRSHGTLGGFLPQNLTEVTIEFETVKSRFLQTLGIAFEEAGMKKEKAGDPEYNVFKTMFSFTGGVQGNRFGHCCLALRPEFWQTPNCDPDNNPYIMIDLKVIDEMPYVEAWCRKDLKEGTKFESFPYPMNTTWFNIYYQTYMTIKAFGEYNKVLNNCQTFLIDLLTKLDMRDYARSLDLGSTIVVKSPLRR